MSHVRIFGIMIAIATLVAMFEMIRRQNIKEKYAVLWFLAAVGIVLVAVYPPGIDVLASATGVQSGPNILFLIGVLVLVVVCVQLSVEVSRLEDRSRALAEEIGLLRLELTKTASDQD